MSTAFSLNAFPPAITVKVELAALSPEQQRDLIAELLRASEVAYIPELKQQIEDIFEVLAFRINPIGSPVPAVIRRATLGEVYKIAPKVEWVERQVRTLDSDDLRETFRIPGNGIEGRLERRRGIDGYGVAINGGPGQVFHLMDPDQIIEQRIES